MKWAVIGLGALALVQSGFAHAGPQTADVWVGFQASDDGFLLDEQSGNIWMTGPCLKRLEQATFENERWMSHTVEMVSIGRTSTVLDQRITLELGDTVSVVTVESAGRGGPQQFEAVTDRNCGSDSSGQCARLIAEQVACQE